MAILIYTSANSDPINTRVDGEADLSGADSLPLSHDFYVAALDSNDSAATFTYQWYITAKPTTSSAVLVNDNTDTVTLDNVDVWGNHRLFCVAQNTLTGEFSEADILKAPNSSFVNLNVISPNAQIEKPAKGERNWFDKANEWAQRIEDLYFDRGTGGLDVDVGGNSASVEGTTGSITIFDGEAYKVRGTTNEIEVTGTNDLDGATNSFVTKIGLPNDVRVSNNLNVGGTATCEDELTVTNSINAGSDIYIAGNLVNSTAPYTNLNTDGQTWYLNRDLNGDGTLDGNCEILTKCDAPTTTERGAPLAGGLVSFPSGDVDFNQDKKIPASNLLHFNSHVEGTIQIALGATSYNLSEYIEAFSTSDQGVWPHLIFRNQSGTTIVTKKVTVLFHDITSYDVGTDGLFDLAYVKSKSILTNSWTNLQGSATWTHTENQHVAYYELDLLAPVAIDDGDFFGIIVGVIPDVARGPVRMSCDITAHGFIQ